MPKNQDNIHNNLNRIAFVDYKPAELHKGKEWRVEFYAKIPAKNEFKRFRKRVPAISPVKEREKYAKKMVVAINQKLESGWSPFYEDNAVKYKTVQFCTDLFLQQQTKEVADDIKRPDTLRSYKSRVAVFLSYIAEYQKNIKFVVEIDVFFVHSYLDYLYFERKCSPQTYNNHLRFLNSFLEWCKIKRYITQNPSENIKPKRKTEKKRKVLTKNIKEKVKTLRNTDFHYFVLCMMTYFCFIRRTEITKIKVSDVNLQKGFIVVSAENSKNRKTETVTIPKAFLPDLAQHLKNAKADDFLFSVDNFKTGNEQLIPKRITDRWAKFRKEEKFDSKFQFYSLKDTGITDLLNSGIPAIKVRDQARHHDLKITESYTARNKFADEMLKNIDFEF